MRSRRFHPCALLPLVLGLGAACAALLPKSERSDFFVLTALEPSSPAPALETPVVVLEPMALPAYLDRRELVTRLTPNQVRVEDFELWAEPLREAVPRIIARDLGAWLGEGKVVRASTAGPTPEHLVSIEVRRFEKTEKKTVELEATWAIVDTRAGTVRVRRDTRLSLAVGGLDTQSAVRVMSAALATMSGAIATELRQLAASAASASPRAGQLR